MGEYVETNPEEDSDDECSQETEKEDEIEPIFEGEDDDNPVYVKQKRNSSIKILGRCRKKRKALMEFRRRLEDAIVGKHLFLKTHEYSAGEKGEEDLKEIRLWGVPLLPSKGDEGTDIILMKFLKAQDWKVAGAFEMLRRTLTWRKNQKIDQILEEKLGDHDLAHAVFVGSTDREGHPVCFNAYKTFDDKEMYRRTFRTEENFKQFLRWIVQVMENNIKKLSFKANGVDSFLQITDLKNSPGPGLKELGPASEPVVTLFQQHYPELIYKNIIINTPFWYYVYHRVVAQHRSQHRTKTKFIFARPYKVTETLLKYISPENIPVQYGGLKRENDEEFTPEDKALEFIVKGGANACIEIPVPEAQVTVVWEVMVVGCEVSFKEEFVPDDEGSYRILLGKEDQQKKVMKMGGSVRNSFYIRESGRILISLRNASFQKKRVFCRYKGKVTAPLHIPY